jgi:hypothetical protein
MNRGESPLSILKKPVLSTVYRIPWYNVPGMQVVIKVEVHPPGIFNYFARTRPGLGVIPVDGIGVVIDAMP